MPRERVAVSDYDRVRHGKKEHVTAYTRMQIVLRPSETPRFFRLRRRKNKPKVSKDPLTRLRQLASSAHEGG